MFLLATIVASIAAITSSVFAWRAGTVAVDALAEASAANEIALGANELAECSNRLFAEANRQNSLNADSEAARSRPQLAVSDAYVSYWSGSDGPTARVRVDNLSPQATQIQSVFLSWVEDGLPRLMYPGDRSAVAIGGFESVEWVFPFRSDCRADLGWDIVDFPLSPLTAVVQPAGGLDRIDEPVDIRFHFESICR